MRRGLLTLTLAILTLSAWAQPLMVNDGALFLPLRHVAETFGATVVWDYGTYVVTVTRGPRTVLIQMHQDDEVLVDGKPLDQLRSSYSHAGVLYVPWPVVAQGLGLQVSYQQARGTATVTDPQSRRTLVVQSPIDDKVGRERADLACTAAHEGDLPGLRALLDLDPRLINAGLLQEAVKGKQQATVRFLLDRGAGINAVVLHKYPQGWSDPTPLETAAADGDAAMVQLLLDRGAKPNIMSSGTPLSAAVRRGDMALVTLLLDRGADATKGSALHIAADTGNTEIAALLLDHGAVVNPPDPYDTPLYQAVGAQEMLMVRFLLEHGADPNLGKYVPLHLAVDYADPDRESATAIDLVELLLKYGADPNMTSEYGKQTALHRASSVEVAAMLLAAGAELNVKDAEGYSPLDMAEREAIYDRRDVTADPLVSYLKQHGAQRGTGNRYWEKFRPASLLDQYLAAKKAGTPFVVRQTDAEGNTLLHLALAGEYVYKHTEEELLALVKELLVAGVDVNATNENGNMALIYAVESHCESVLPLLLTYKPDLNKADAEGLTALHHAAHDGKIAMVQALLMAGADPKVTDKAGRTPLHWMDSVAVGELLLKAGADVRAVDLEGNTPLHAASRRSGSDIITWLLTHGAVTEAKNKAGKTAMHLAADDFPREGERLLVQVLMQAGADVKARDGQQATPLHYAGSTAVVQLLLDAGAEINARDARGRTPMHTVRDEAIHALLARGGDVNAVDAEGCTPLHTAFDNRWVEMTTLLEAGANINAVDKQGRTPLHIAVISGRARDVEVLLQHGANLAARDAIGMTPLLLAVAGSNDDPALVRLLLASGAAINATDKAGNTPLHLTAQADHPRLVRFLLARGASPTTRNAAGATPLDVATGECVALLKNAGQK